MNYNQIYESKIRLVVSLILLFGIFLNMSCFGKHNQPEVCKRFYSSGPRSEKRFLSHSIEDQFKLHRCSLQQIPSIGRSGAMAKGGEKLVPFLVEKLNAKHKNYYERDLTILAAAQVLALLPREHLDNHRYVVPLLERKISRMKYGVRKEGALWALKTIKDERVLDLLDGEMRRFGLPSLRKVEVADDDLEMRIWVGFGYPTLSGFILERKENKWSASYLPQYQKSKEAPKPSLITLDRPVIGWDKLWSRLEEQDIMAEYENDTEKFSFNAQGGVFEVFTDSTSVLVEVLIHNRHRYYSYHAPCYSKAKGAKKLLKAVKVLEENFKINIHNCS